MIVIDEYLAVRPGRGLARCPAGRRAGTTSQPALAPAPAGSRSRIRPALPAAGWIGAFGVRLIPAQKASLAAACKGLRKKVRPANHTPFAPDQRYRFEPRRSRLVHSGTRTQQRGSVDGGRDHWLVDAGRAFGAVEAGVAESEDSAVSSD